jgi:hypothetical protein
MILESHDRGAAFVSLFSMVWHESRHCPQSLAWGSETKTHRESGTTREAFPLWCANLSAGLKKKSRARLFGCLGARLRGRLPHTAHNADAHRRCASRIIDLLLWRWAPSEHASAGTCSHVDQTCIECARVLSEATAISSPLA